jgi:phage shock protein A
MTKTHTIIVALAAIGFTLACASSAFANTAEAAPQRHAVASDEVKRLRAETKAMQQQIAELRAAKQIEQARAQHAKTVRVLTVLQNNNK